MTRTMRWTAATRVLSPLRSIHTTAPLDPAPSATAPPPVVPVASSSTSASAAEASSSRTVPSLPSLISASSPSLALPTDVPAALRLLKAQSTPSTGLYLLARLHSRTYLLHPRDILTLPRLKPLQPPGTTLALSRILEVGSRDYAIRAPAAETKYEHRKLGWLERKALPTVPENVARCELTVLEHTTSPMEYHLKKKRRKGYEKTIKHKQGYTRLRVGDIFLGDGVGAAAGQQGVREPELIIATGGAPEAEEGVGAVPT